MNLPTLQPEPPDQRIDETRGFWRELGKTMVKNSLTTIDETARQVITVAGVVAGLYFNAIAFSDLQGQVQGGSHLLAYLAPIALLLLSLGAGLLVFFPDHYRLNFESSEASKLVYERAVASKLLLLRIASVCLLLGVAALLFAVLTYLRG